MKIEIAGYSFSTGPVSRPDSVFMCYESTGEGTEIDLSKIQVALAELFRQVM